MAVRTVQECYNILATNITTLFANAGISINPANWSKANKLRNILYSVAIAQSTAEQFQEDYLTQINETLSKIPAGSKKWIQHKMFQFQYSTTTPQVLSYIDNVPQYENINDALKIITACSVQQTASGYVSIKCAKGSPLEALDSSQKSAAQDYINTLGTAGVYYTIISDNPDKIRIEGDIYYNGSYSTTIQASVIDAINNYLASLSVNKFDGNLLLSELRAFIKSITGVNDVVLKRVSCRYDSLALFGGVDLVIDYDEQFRSYQMGAGYIIEETTSGNTFSDTLNFIPE